VPYTEQTPEGGAMSEDTKQFLIKLLGGGLIVGSIVVGVIRLSSPSNTPVTDDIEACVELRMDAIWEEYRRDPSPMSTFWEQPEDYRSQVTYDCLRTVQGADR
tara:strand:+ start:13558 stop:13866 length:309 start_codon:yes stop_codon:yes gene_type:complete